MRCIAIGSHKGGTGKSTITIGIAQWFALQGARTCVVEGDLLGAGLDLIVDADREERIARGTDCAEDLRPSSELNHLSDFIYLPEHSSWDPEMLDSYLYPGLRLPEECGQPPNPGFDILLAWAGYGGYAPGGLPPKEGDRERLDCDPVGRLLITSSLCRAGGNVAKCLRVLWRSLEKRGYQYCVIDLPPGLLPPTLSILESLAGQADKVLVLTSTPSGPSIAGLVPDLDALRRVSGVGAGNWREMVHAANKWVDPNRLEGAFPALWKRYLGDLGERGLSSLVELTRVEKLDSGVTWIAPPPWGLFSGPGSMNIERLGEKIVAGVRRPKRK